MKSIKTVNLVKIYGKRKVVNDVSINLQQGEIVGILGPNGAGKSTTFYMILGLIKANSGNVFFNEKPITDLPMYKRAQLGIGYLAQEPSIFHKLTVEQNIMAILETLKISKKERNTLLRNPSRFCSPKHNPIGRKIIIGTLYFSKIFRFSIIDSSPSSIVTNMVGFFRFSEKASL